jgi:uncharacterized membrane protein YdfJ with MMPL/SSD domain
MIEKLRNLGFLTGGLTASVFDLKNYCSFAFTELEFVIAVVIGLILSLSLRSGVYPLISLSGVMISITWTTSILLIITKYIAGQSIVFLVPVVLSVILMSLGNDFTVFILTRVKEEISKFGLVSSCLKILSLYVRLSIFIIDVEALQDGSDGQKFNDVKGVMKDAIYC